MAQRKQKQLEGPSAQAIAQRARRAKELSTISEIADQNLNPTDGWRTILPEHIEAIKTRLLGGDTLSNACRGLGINEASVTRYFHENKDELKDFLDWKAHGTHRMWDRLIDMIDDKEMSAGDKMFAYKVINSYTGKINRPVYGESVQVDQNVTVSAPVMPDWFFGSVVDGKLTDDSDPTI